MADGGSPKGQLVGEPTGGIELDEYITVDPPEDEAQIIRLENGDEIHTMDDPEEEPEPVTREFYSNLAEILPDATLMKLATDQVRKVEQDKRDREARDKQYEEGIKRTGLGNDAPGGADFEGASRVVHPVMTESCIDFYAAVIKEIWPLSGPLKSSVIGKSTAEKVERANRKTDFMNYQLKNIIVESRTVLEQTLTQVPLGGSQFIRMWWDHSLKRPRWEFAAIDKVYVPYNAADFRSAIRRTYVDTINAVEFRKRVDSGQYRDIKSSPPAMRPEQTKSEQASNKVEGKDDGVENLDGDRDIFETTCYVEISEETAETLNPDNDAGLEEAGEMYPYILSIDSQSKEIVAMYRDWEKADKTREPLDHLYEFPFIPWRGAYSIGFPQIIGGLSAAATGSLRALLDSAHVNNAATGAILKGSGASGQTRNPRIGEMLEIDAGMEADDIRKRIMKFDFVQPSQVLFTLLGFVVEAAKGVVRTTLDETTTAQGNTNVPVGTQLSRVEQGMKVFSTILGRQYMAFDRLIDGLHRFNRLYLPETVTVDAAGKEIMVLRKDFDGPRDTVPVADPTIYSDAQRFAQLSYLQQRAQLVPQLYKLRDVELAGLKLIKWPDPESLLNPAPTPHELNAVNENLAMTQGKPVMVFPEQDHLAHIQVLLDFMRHPMLGMNPLIAPKFLPLALQHLADHIVYFYVSHTVQVVEKAAKRDVKDLMDDDYRLKAKFDQLLAMASQLVVPALTQTFGQIQPIIQEMMQAVKQFQPPPPMDPATAALAAAKQETDRKAQADQMGHQIDTAGVQNDAQKNQIALGELQLDQQKVQAIADAAQLAANTKLASTSADNQTALEIASMRPTGMKDGASMAGT